MKKDIMNSNLKWFDIYFLLTSSLIACTLISVCKDFVCGENFGGCIRVVNSPFNKVSWPTVEASKNFALGDGGYNPGVTPNGIGLFRLPGKIPDCISLKGEAEACMEKD